MTREVPTDIFERLLEAVPAPAKPEATRSLSSKMIQKAADLVPSLCGGSADLDPSTKTSIKGSASIAKGQFEGRNFHFGIREHGMGSILNGMALHGGFIPYGATFLIFSDYMRPPMRLAALMGIQVIYVFTHDSVFLGEDGPTHQPIEQLAGLRSVPNMRVIRPADGPETAMAWALALRRRGGPTALILSRQSLPPIQRETGPEPLMRGGYIASTENGGSAPAAGSLVLIATGSEVAPSIEAQAILARRGVAARVVSMPCPELYMEQDAAYREAVVPRNARVVVIEAARLQGWERVAGRDALLIGIDRFGASAPLKVLAEKFGFTGPQIADRILGWPELR